MGRGAREQESSAFLLLLLLLLPPPSLLPVFFFSRSVRRDPRPLTRHAKRRLTYARERACTLEKRKKKKKKKRRKRKGKGSGRERKKRGEQIRAPPRREARGLCALRFKAVLSFDWRRERTQSNSYPPLPSPPLPSRASVIIDERFYSRGSLCRVPELKTSMPAT